MHDASSSLAGSTFGKIMYELELVINVKFGGFSFNTEMSSWLKDNHNWTILSHEEYDYKLKDEYPLTTLIKHIGDYFYSPHSEKIALRSHPDLIECIRTLQKIHENDSFREKHYSHIFSLEVRKVKINLEIEDYYDGKERINSYLVESE